jgi:hypothetical protein
MLDTWQLGSPRVRFLRSLSITLRHPPEQITRVIFHPLGPQASLMHLSVLQTFQD